MPTIRRRAARIRAGALRSEDPVRAPVEAVARRNELNAFRLRGIGLAVEARFGRLPAPP